MEKKKCFIITPIGNANEPIRRHIDGIIKAAIKPALEDEYEICVAHDMNKAGSITRQVIEEIYSSDLVIANLTNKNPNVMYELAFRHCLGKPVIQIMEEGTVLPFDIGTERTIPYINDSQGVLELRENISKFMTEINFEESKQGPIYDVLKGISYEENIIKELEGSKVNLDTDILKYLLNKIEVLDTKIDKSLLPDKTQPRNFRRKSIEFIVNPTLDTLDLEVKKTIVNSIFNLNSKYKADAVGEIGFPKGTLELYLNSDDIDIDDYIKSIKSILNNYSISVLSIIPRK